MMSTVRPATPTEPTRWPGALRDLWLAWRHPIVLGLYALLTVGMTWPVVPRLATHLPGQGQDLWVHWWNFWWLGESLLQGETPFFTGLLFHPRGVSLVYHNFAWAQFFSWLPLQAVIGSTAAFGVVILLMFAVSGFAMYLLAKDVTGDPWAAFVAGTVYAFWPYAQSHFNHPNYRAIPSFPLTLLYLRRVLRQGRRRDVVGLTLSIALVGLTRWQLLTMEAILVGLYLAHDWITRHGDRRWQHLLQVGLAGVVAFLVMVPLLSPILADLVQGGIPSEVMIDEQVQGQTDLMAYVLPVRYHPLWGDAVWPWYENLIVNKFYMAFVGYVAVGLAVYGLFRERRRGLFWALLALVVVFLALGPVLRINGKLLEGVPTPYRLIGTSVFVRALRKPDRFNILLGLPVAVLVAWGVVDFRRRVPSTVGAGLTVLLAGLILFEYCMVPFPTARVALPGWYEDLKRESGVFAVLDLPMDPVTFDKRYMTYQVVHGKPMVGGKVSRLTASALGFVLEHPFLRGLYEDGEMDPGLTDVSRQLDYLAENDVRYIVLHKDNLLPATLARWKDWLTFEPVHESQDVVVYHTDPVLGRDFQLTGKMTDSLGFIRCTTSPTATTQAGNITIDARWASAAPLDRRLRLELSLRSAAGDTVQSKRVPLSQDWPTDAWPANAVVRAKYIFQVEPFTPPGEHSLYLTLIDEEEGQPVGEPFKAETLSVSRLPRSFAVPSMEHELRASFGGDLSLLGYDVRRDCESIHVMLHWRAQTRMEVAYKFFVHVVDADSGDVVAQTDVMPRDWTYPTTWWQEGEVVSDEITVPVSHLPAGTYRLAVGVYHPDTGERLPISRAADLSVEDRRLWLPSLLER